ncbi:hypothetical protein BLOT_011085 [Blomia tropicalis]|nr:hypothetical protein BLOT_011085 [Blomia tropicalis]
MVRLNLDGILSGNIMSIDRIGKYSFSSWFQSRDNNCELIFVECRLLIDFNDLKTRKKNADGYCIIGSSGTSEQQISNVCLFQLSQKNKWNDTEQNERIDHIL